MVSHYKENAIEQGKPMMGIILNYDKKNEKITAFTGFSLQFVEGEISLMKYKIIKFQKVFAASGL